jgi:hypothetical protein
MYYIFKTAKDLPICRSCQGILRFTNILKLYIEKQRKFVRTKVTVRADQIQSHRNTFDGFAKKLGIISLDDWYKVSDTDLAKLNAARVISKFYGGNLYSGRHS